MSRHGLGLTMVPLPTRRQGLMPYAAPLAGVGLAALLLPALMIAGHHPRQYGVHAAIAFAIAVAACAVVARLVPRRALAPLGIAIVAVAAALLAQISFHPTIWLVALNIGGGIALTLPALDRRAWRRAAPASLLAALGLIAVHWYVGRSTALVAGVAAVCLMGVGAAAVPVPRRPRPLVVNGIAVAAGIVTLLTVAWIGASTARATWFGSLVYHGSRQSNLVAITFDDGPNVDYTLKVRDILDEHGVKATFFTVGKALDARPDVTRALYADGELLGNHSYRHDSVHWLDPGYGELQLTQDAFKRDLGVCPAFFRPPHGTHTPFMAHQVHERGMEMITWDVSAGDWATSDGRLVAQRVLAKVKPGSIILLHDGMNGDLTSDRSVILTALPIILDGLKARGLKPVTLDVLLGRPGYLPRC